MSEAPLQSSTGRSFDGLYFLGVFQYIEICSGKWTNPHRVILFGDFCLHTITRLELSQHQRSFIGMQTHFPAVFLLDQTVPIFDARHVATHRPKDLSTPSETILSSASKRPTSEVLPLGLSLAVVGAILFP